MSRKRASHYSRVMEILPYPHRPNIVAITNDGYRVHRNLYPLPDGLTLYSVRSLAYHPGSRTTYKCKWFAEFIEWFDHALCENVSLEIGSISKPGHCKTRGTDIEAMHDLRMEGMKAKEIAQTLDIGYDTVCMYLKARNKTKWAKDCDGNYTLIGDLPDPYGAWICNNQGAKNAKQVAENANVTPIAKNAEVMVQAGLSDIAKDGQYVTSSAPLTEAGNAKSVVGGRITSSEQHRKAA